MKKFNQIIYISLFEFKTNFKNISCIFNVTATCLFKSVAILILLRSMGVKLIIFDAVRNS